MRFESPWAFLVLLSVPLALLLRARFAGRLGSLRFSSTGHARQLGQSWRQRFAWVPTALRVLALVSLAVALARPQQGREQSRDVSKGVAIEMVVDRSGSMSTEMQFAGEHQSRLDVAKQAFRDFVMGDGGKLPGRPNDLVGMVTFARYADTVCPLTLAHGAAMEFLKSIQVASRREEDGTSIGDAIALAAARLKTAEETLSRETGKDQKDFDIKSKVIVLLTDGQNNAGRRSPAEAAALAKSWGIKIYAIGIGGEEGMARQSGMFGEFMVPVDEGVDKETLKGIASATGGAFYMAENAEGMRSICREIDRLERSEIESVRYLDYREIFIPAACLAMVLMCVEIGLGCTVFRKIP
jgi:Ca-activated chloride channel family protein